MTLTWHLSGFTWLHLTDTWIFAFTKPWLNSRPLHSMKNTSLILSGQNVTSRFLMWSIYTNILMVLANFLGIWKTSVTTVATLWGYDNHDNHCYGGRETSLPPQWKGQHGVTTTTTTVTMAAQEHDHGHDHHSSRCSRGHDHHSDSCMSSAGAPPPALLPQWWDRGLWWWQWPEQGHNHHSHGVWPPPQWQGPTTVVGAYHNNRGSMTVGEHRHHHHHNGRGSVGAEGNHHSHRGSMEAPPPQTPVCHHSRTMTTTSPLPSLVLLRSWLMFFDKIELWMPRKLAKTVGIFVEIDHI